MIYVNYKWRTFVFTTLLEQFVVTCLALFPPILTCVQFLVFTLHVIITQNDSLSFSFFEVHFT